MWTPLPGRLEWPLTLPRAGPQVFDPDQRRPVFYLLPLSHLKHMFHKTELALLRCTNFDIFYFVNFCKVLI